MTTATLTDNLDLFKRKTLPVISTQYFIWQHKFCLIN